MHYINYFKTLEIEEPEGEIKITKESTREEVEKFLKKYLQFSDKAIEALDLDGNSFFNLDEDYIDGEEDLAEEEKIKLKNYLKEQNLLIKKENVNNIKQKLLILKKMGKKRILL